MSSRRPIPIRSCRTSTWSRRTAPRISRTARSSSGRRRRIPAPGAKLVAATLGIPESDVTVNMTRIGGGFGRRLRNDFMVEAAWIAKQAGVPVKLLWNRAGRHAARFLPPGGIPFLQGRPGREGQAGRVQRSFRYLRPERQAGRFGADWTPTSFPRCWCRTRIWPVGDGARRADRAAACAAIERAGLRLPVLHRRTGASGRPGPGGVPLALLGEPRVLVNSSGKPDALRDFDTGRMRDVLARSRRYPAGRDRHTCRSGTGKGVAFYFSHLGYFAEVVQATVAARATSSSTRSGSSAMSAARSSIRAAPRTRSQGAALDGLGAALGQAITIDRGRVVQANFDTVKPLRINQVPPVRCIS